MPDRNPVVLGRDKLVESESGRQVIDREMLRAAHCIGRHLSCDNAGRQPQQPFASFQPNIEKELRQLLQNLAQRTPDAWFHELHGAVFNLVQYISSFPLALRPIMQMLHFEPLLYFEPTGKWYKDHIVHQLRVTRTLFGLLMAFERRYPYLMPPERCAVLYPAALIGGLFHDIGYPLILIQKLTANKFVSHWNMQFDISINALGVPFERSSIKNFLTMLGVRDEAFKWTREQLKNDSTKNHAFLSGLWLLGFNQEIAVRRRAPVYVDADSLGEIFDLAAAAAFFHHLHEQDVGSDVVLSVREQPLLVLMQLADALQEWGRPIVVRDKHTEQLDFMVPNSRLAIVAKDMGLGEFLASPGEKVPEEGEDWSETTVEKVQTWWKNAVRSSDNTTNLKDQLKPDGMTAEKLWSLVNAGWEPWRPCSDVPKALASLDKDAVSLLWDLDETLHERKETLDFDA